MSNPPPFGLLRCPICKMTFKTRVVMAWHMWKRHQQR